MTLMMSVALSLLSAAAPVVAVTYDCKHIRVDRQSFDLSALAGEHSVSHLEHHPPIMINTTYTVNVCGQLERKKDVPKEKQCPLATRICAIERELPEKEESESEEEEEDGANSADKHDADGGGADDIRGVIPIAGEYVLQHGGPLDPKWTRLKTSSSNADSAMEGLRLELHGGRYPFAAKHGRKQKAIIEFVCDRDRTGLEGQGQDKEDDDDEDAGDDKPSTPPGDNDDDVDDDEGGRGGRGDDGKSLRFIRYEPTSEDVHEDTLRLEWRTKYACEGVRDEEGQKKKKNGGHWGFFTWFIIMWVFLFLCLSPSRPPKDI